MSTPDILLEQAKKFIGALVSDGSLDPTTCISRHFSTPETAHRYSTAYHIVAGMIPRECLMQHPIDSDGNVWFRKEWLLFANLEPHPEAYLDAVIRSHAASLSKETWSAEWNAFKGRTLTLRWPLLGYALEGYPENSPQRHPNLETVQVSKHISGMAVDITLRLNGINNNGINNNDINNVWDAHIDATARKFGLYRPYAQHSKTPEYWHFELLDG